MPLYFITGSKHKFAEVKAIIPWIEQISINPQEIQEVNAHKVLEAKLSAVISNLLEFRPYLFSKHKSPAFIVEDTSLYFSCLGNLPGPLIKWFLQEIGNDNLYKIALAFNDFRATAVTHIGYSPYGCNGFAREFIGTVYGTIVAPRGTTNFGWDPIFQPDGYSKTFAEMTTEEKNAISMRRLAAEKLKAYLDTLNN